MYKDNIKTSQIAHWSILSNVVNYVQYHKDPKNLCDLNIKVLDKKNHSKLYEKLTEDERHTLDIDLLTIHANYKGNIWTCMKEFNQRY